MDDIRASHQGTELAKVPVKQLSSSFLKMDVGGDEKEPKFVQGCIDALITFDETKRD